MTEEQFKKLNSKITIIIFCVVFLVVTKTINGIGNSSIVAAMLDEAMR